MAPSIGLLNNTQPKHIREVRRLSTEEYADYRKASSTLLRFPEDQDRYQDVLIGFYEYMDVLANHENTLREGRHINGPGLRRELNTKLSNYLRAVRAFDDHSQKALSDRYGKGSDQLTRFIKATNEVYDQSFSYRLLEQVRNFTQHVGEAINQISYGWRAPDPKTRTAEPYITLEFERDAFLEWRKLKPSFRPELEQQPERIPVTTHVEQVAGCIKYLNNVCIAQQLSDFVAAAKHIIVLLAPLEGEAGVPVIYTFDAPGVKVGKPGNFNLHAEPIPADLARFILAPPPED